MSSYYKKQKLFFACLIAGILLFVVVVCGVFFMRSGGPGAAKEEKKYTVTVYKSQDGLVTAADEKQKAEDDETKLILKVAAGENVGLDVKANEGKVFSRADVTDANALTLTTSENSQADGEERISFTMPKSNVTVNIFYLSDLGEESSDLTPTLSGIEIFGLTEAIRNSYDGHFDQEEFVQAVISWFGISNAVSEYHNVYKLTFLEEEYDTGSSDSVANYFYFNDDQDWKILSVYDIPSHSYTFTDIRKKAQEDAAQKAKMEEEERQRQAQLALTVTPMPTGAPVSDPAAPVLQENNGNGYTGAAENTQPQQITVESTFDIVDVSTVFLQYVGGEEIFYNTVSDYVFGKGLTGIITGTFTEYTIDPEKEQASFIISMSTGAAIQGTYSKDSGNFQLNGL